MSEYPLVTASWVSTHLDDPDLYVVDASWHLPQINRNAEKEYVEAHIPGAVFFDIDRYAAVSELPHMMPGVEEFAQFAGGLGINEKSTIIVYDSYGLFSAARVWWMFKVFGAKSVRLLDGGLPAWRAEGQPLECGVVSPERVNFNAKLSPAVTVTAEHVLRVAKNGKAQIFDARSRGRFTAQEKEFRPGLRSGHIPGSICLPFTDLLDKGCLKSREGLQSVFAKHDFDPAKPVIASCGSGVTAAVICLALECIGVTDAQIYDGSWTEWGGREDLPVATGS